MVYPPIPHRPYRHRRCPRIHASQAPRRLDTAGDQAPASSRIPVQHREGLRSRLGLSPREMEVALRVMDGQGLKGIAGDLGLSVHTVDTHRRRMYEKLGVHKRSEVPARLFVAHLDWLRDSGYLRLCPVAQTRVT